MDAASDAIPPDRLHLFPGLIWAGEYVIGIEDFLANVRPTGWTDDHIDLLVQACQLVAGDPRPSI